MTQHTWQESHSRRPLTPDDLWAMKRVGGPVPSPIGRHVAVPVTEFDAGTNRGRTRLWLLTEGDAEPRPLTSDEASSDQPAWSPDGQQLAFVRRKDGEKPQVYRIRVAGGEAEKLTDLPLGAFDPKWFPDGRRLAFAAAVLLPDGGGATPAAPDASATDPSDSRPAEPESVARTRRLLAARESEPVKARVTEDRVFRFWDRWLTDGQAPHLFVLDLPTRRLTDMTPESTHGFDVMAPSGQYDLAPDGTEIVFSAESCPPPYDLLRSGLFAVSLTHDGDGGTTAGPLRHLTAGASADNLRPRYTPDGAALLYGRTLDPHFYADTVRLVRLDRSTGADTVLTDHWDRSATAWELSRDGSRVFVLAEDQARAALFVMAVEPGAPARRLVSGGSVGALAVGPGDQLWFTYQDLSTPPEAAACGPDGGAFGPRTTFNAPLLATLEMGCVEERVFPGAAGNDVQMWVLFPPGFDRAKRWPLVQVIHGGPHAISADAFHWRWNAQAFAAPGYVVALVNFHGSTSWGQEFAASILGAHGDKPFADIMAATELLVAEGYVDETRMAAIGGSYGGYLVTWIAGHTDRFACLVSHAGVYDLLSQYASDVSQGRARAYGGEPWDGLENIDRWSPCRFAAGFSSPLLVLHGDNDYRVPYTQGLEVYGVYKAKGLPARLVSYPDENHWILSARNSLHWYNEVLSWIRRWFRGDAGHRRGP